MFRKTLAAAALMLAAHGGALAQTLNEGEVLGNFSPTPGPAVPTDLTGTAGFGLFGNGVGSAPSYQGYLGYTASTPRTWQGKGGDFVNVMDYAADNGCVPDSVADCTAALNAAILAVYNYSQSGGATLSVSGTVHVPASAGCFRITSAITMKHGVSLVGEGGIGSCIMADDTDALSYAYNAYYGQPQVSGIFLYGVNPSAARTAIKRTQTVADADTDTQYGLSIQNTLIWGFDTAIDVTTMRNLWVTNSYFQNVNNCAKINGFSFGIRLQGVQCSRASGDGLGSIGDGFVTSPYTYTTGSQLGAIGPEGIEINQSQIFGFNTALWFKKGAFYTVTNSDVLALVDGLRFGDVFGGLYVKNTYFDMQGSAVQHAIWGESIAASHSANHQTLIEGNTLLGTNTVAASCIQINEPGTTNQFNVNILSNHCRGFVAYDLVAYLPGSMTVEGNFFKSTGVTDSINIGARQTGVIKVEKNEAVSTIAAVAGDVTSGYVRLCNNVSSGSTLDGCDIYTPTIHGSMTAGAINSSGNIAASTFNNILVPTPASTAVLTLGSAKSIVINSSLTLTGTDGTVMTFPTSSATIARTDAGQSFAGTQVFSDILSSTGYKTSAAPATAAHFDSSAMTALTIASGACAAIAPAGASYGFVHVSEIAVSGYGAMYLLEGAGVYDVRLSGPWVAPTTTPAATKMSVAWGGSGYEICNNFGSTGSFKVSTFKTAN